MLETNPLGISVTAWSKHLAKMEETVEWTDPRLKKITRLRLLSDGGYPAWDVSYCHGELQDGTPVWVELPFSQLPKGQVRGAIVQHAKRDRVYAKGLGVFEAISLFQ